MKSFVLGAVLSGLIVGSLWANDMTQKAGVVVDKAATGTTQTTDSGAANVNSAVTSTAGDNAVTKPVTQSVNTQSEKGKRRVHHGATKVKKAMGDTSAAANNASTTATNTATDASNAAANATQKAADSVPATTH